MAEDEDDDTFADMSPATTQDHYLNGGNKDAALCLALLCSGAGGDHGGTMLGVSGPMVSLMDSDSTKSLFDLDLSLIHI